MAVPAIRQVFTGKIENVIRQDAPFPLQLVVGHSYSYVARAVCLNYFFHTVAKSCPGVVDLVGNKNALASGHAPYFRVIIKPLNLLHCFSGSIR